MERRLTYNYKDIFDTYDPIDVYDNDYSKINFQKVLRKLAHYKDLEEQGRLIELPCKVGDTVYYPEKEFNFVYPVKISEIILSDLGNGEQCFQFNGCFFDGNGDPNIEFDFDNEDFGNIVFLTKEEAEAALKESEKE